LENIQVYRARLNGGSAPIGIADDLRRGKRPPPIFNVTIAPGADQPGGPPPEASPQAETPAADPKPVP
jgi:soluble lytic murein transglycosylase